MIGNKLEQSIISIFEDNPSSTFSINEISKILKKSYPNINKKSNFLLKEGVLGKIIIGKSYQCYLDLNNDKARILAAMNEINKRDALLLKDKNFQAIIEEINTLGKKLNVETVLLHKNSLLFIIKDSSSERKMLDAASLKKDFTLLFIDRKAFQERFITDYDLQKSHHILYKTENYISVLSEISDRLLMAKKLRNMNTKP